MQLAWNTHCDRHATQHYPVPPTSAICQRCVVDQPEQNKAALQLAGVEHSCRGEQGHWPHDHKLVQEFEEQVRQWPVQAIISLPDVQSSLHSDAWQVHHGRTDWRQHHEEKKA